MAALAAALRETPAENPAEPNELDLLPEPFLLSLSRHRDAVLAEVVGPLDVENAPRFREELLPKCEGQRTIVDLLRAEYVDSEGVRALLAVQEATDRSGGTLRLVLEAGSRAERTLRLLRLDARFRIFRSRREALAGGN